ncbi:MAG TPA: sigma-70 family RNA polymerase sigma factor [Vicinamibacterales bacterium]|nr:sigma-70 family RNA polymerase sigma factor [Vicinamibacterales bacterium]
MNELVGRLSGSLVNDSTDLDACFEARLLDSFPLAFRVAFSVLRQRQDAEDIAQEAFVRARRRAAELRDRDRFRGWLVRMVWRMALDRRRGEKRREAREQVVAIAAAAQPTVEDDAIARERESALWTAIDGLPEKLRVAIVLSSIEGHDVKSVATLLAIPEGTVKSRLFLARKQLEESLSWLVNPPTIR